MSSGKYRPFWRTVYLCLLFATACFGQETTGAVRGSVTDPSHAGVPAVSVELTGGLIPRALVTSTDATAYYSFSQVPPGTGYTLSVNEPGFRNAKFSGVNVQLG